LKAVGSTYTDSTAIKVQKLARNAITHHQKMALSFWTFTARSSWKNCGKTYLQRPDQTGEGIIYVQNQWLILNGSGDFGGQPERLVSVYTAL
jgi:hypothetical protein